MREPGRPESACWSPPTEAGSSGGAGDASSYPPPKRPNDGVASTLARPARECRSWLPDALHVSDSGRGAGVAKGTRRPVIGATPNWDYHAIRRTGDRRIDSRAIGAVAVAGTGKGAAREAGDVDDGPLVPRAANDCDPSARPLHRHGATGNTLHVDPAGPLRRVENSAIGARDAEVEVVGPGRAERRRGGRGRGGRGRGGRCGGCGRRGGGRRRGGGGRRGRRRRDRAGRGGDGGGRRGR